jgi:anti-anti-sigma regulatory factor
VNINVAINVNLNTVSVLDSSGASVLVNQTLDFGGTISAFEP